MQSLYTCMHNRESLYFMMQIFYMTGDPFYFMMQLIYMTGNPFYFRMLLLYDGESLYMMMLLLYMHDRKSLYFMPLLYMTANPFTSWWYDFTWQGFLLLNDAMVLNDRESLSIMLPLLSIYMESLYFMKLWLYMTENPWTTWCNFSWKLLDAQMRQCSPHRPSIFLAAVLLQDCKMILTITHILMPLASAQVKMNLGYNIFRRLVAFQE